MDNIDGDDGYDGDNSSSTETIRSTDDELSLTKRQDTKQTKYILWPIVDWFKGPSDWLDTETYHLIMLAFERYYDHMEGFPHEVDPFITDFLSGYGIQFQSLKIRYRVVIESEKIIVSLLKRNFEEGKKISKRALILANSKAPEFILRIRSYIAALYRDEGLFGRTEKELTEGAKIYSAVSSYEERCFFHFNAGRAKISWLYVCTSNKVAEVSRQQGILHFRAAIYFAQLGLHKQMSVCRSSLKRMPVNGSLQLAILHFNCFGLFLMDFEKQKTAEEVPAANYELEEGRKCLLLGYQENMPLLPQIYFSLGCSDYFYREKSVEKSYIFAKWCELKCKKHDLKTEYKFSTRRVLFYKRELALLRPDEIEISLENDFQRYFSTIRHDLKGKEDNLQLLITEKGNNLFVSSVDCDQKDRGCVTTTCESTDSGVGEPFKSGSTCESMVVSDSFRFCNTEFSTPTPPDVSVRFSETESDTSVRERLNCISLRLMESEE